MKRITIALVLASFLVLGSVAAYAGSAYDASFTTSVTYQNLGDAAANVQFSFYDANSQVTTESRTLAAGAGASLYVGSVSNVGAGFQGSGVVVADQPIAATMVQISEDPDVRNRPLSNGFTEGAERILLPSVLKSRFNTTSRFSIQNAQGAGGSAATITVSIYDADNPSATPAFTLVEANVPAGSARYFDMGTLSQIPTGFNGSAVVTADAPIVGTVMELNTVGGAASSFEAVTGGAPTVYMPTALCDVFGGATTFYAIQNTAESGTATVTVTYSTGGSQSVSIAGGSKASINSCNTLAAGTSGAATITSTGGDIVVIGKVSGAGNSTAFAGEISGSSTLALPYVRFTEGFFTTGGRQRAYIAIQNVGGDLPAGAVTATYLDKDGNAVGRHTFGAIAAGAKVNTHAINGGVASLSSSFDMGEFGYNNGFGGAVLVEGTTGSEELVAVVRIQSKDGGSFTGEDYNGIPAE